MADGPLIVQSDRTVLLEVAHPDAEIGAPRAGDLRRARARARAHPHLPDHPARAVERARGRPRRRRHARRRSSAGRASRCRRRCRSTSARPSAATGGSSIERNDDGELLLHRDRHRRADRGLAQQAHPAPADRPPVAGLVRRSTPGRAATSSRSCSRSAGRPRTSPDTRPGTPHPIELDERDWSLRPVPAQGRRHLHRGRLRRRRAPLRRRQDARRRGRDGRHRRPRP